MMQDAIFGLLNLLTKILNGTTMNIKGRIKNVSMKKQRQEYAAYRFNNFMPHLSNC